MRRIRRILACLLLAAAPAAAGAATGPLHLAQQEDGVSLQEATARVRAQTGGRILSAETVGQGDSRVHRIKVLTRDQRVRIIEIDPRTGKRR